MNRRMCRQVLDCGDGVGEVTALGRAAPDTPTLAAKPVTATKSGDSADSVAAVQDASRADLIRTGFMVPMRARFGVKSFQACGKGTATASAN